MSDLIVIPDHMEIEAAFVGRENQPLVQVPATLIHTFAQIANADSLMQMRSPKIPSNFLYQVSDLFLLKLGQSTEHFQQIEINLNS